MNQWGMGMHEGNTTFVHLVDTSHEMLMDGVRGQGSEYGALPVEVQTAGRNCAECAYQNAVRRRKSTCSLPV